MQADMRPPAETVGLTRRRLLRALLLAPAFLPVPCAELANPAPPTRIRRAREESGVS